MTPTPAGVAIGAVTNFLDALGIGSFATSTAAFRRWRLVEDRVIPGTLNVGHALPTLTQAIVFIRLVPVEVRTLVGMIVAASLGAWIGAGVVAGLPVRPVRLGMGLALLVAGVLMSLSAAGFLPGGGTAFGLTGTPLIIGLAGNFILGALMTLGIGLYAPCMILVYLLGMHPTAAFPIMMGSCAALMPLASLRFVRAGSYDGSMSLSLAMGGVPAVLVAAFLVRSLPLDAVRILVVAVVFFTAAGLLRSALEDGSPTDEQRTRERRAD